MKTKNELLISHALSELPASKLCDLWEETEKYFISLQLFNVRGWIMDALAAKDPIAFSNWMNNDYSENPAGDSPKYWYNE